MGSAAAVAVGPAQAPEEMVGVDAGIGDYLTQYAGAYISAVVARKGDVDTGVIHQYYVASLLMTKTPPEPLKQSVSIRKAYAGYACRHSDDSPHGRDVDAEAIGDAFGD